jgi:hypothetical protein
MGKNKRKVQQTEAMRRRHAQLPPAGKNFGSRKDALKRKKRYG